ncbi:MAG: ribonuclease H-like domain-containing protein [Saprospiraceae bacterium]|nr:ribonuclease H-like domain-containing protein [Saprospiraceae bacterium]
MIENIKIYNILFIDLETVSNTSTFSQLHPRLQEHWAKKAQFVDRSRSEGPLEEEVVAQLYQDKAAIYAEFGKIVCISIGYLHRTTQEFRMKSFSGHDEKRLLQEFVDLVSRYFYDPEEHLICGHNIREFDIPYLCRRLVVHSLELPSILNLSGKKPWETMHLIDTMQLWKFGDFKNYTSLDLLAAVLDIETPKDDIDGSMVGRVYWEDGDLNRIATYCEKDVVTVAQVLLKMKGADLIAPEKIVSV